MSSARTCLLVQALRSAGNKSFLYISSTLLIIQHLLFLDIFSGLSRYSLSFHRMFLRKWTFPLLHAPVHTCAIYIYSTSSSVRNAQPCMRYGRHSSLSSVNTYIVSVCLSVCMHIHCSVRRIDTPLVPFFILIFHLFSPFIL